MQYTWFYFLYMSALSIMFWLFVWNNWTSWREFSCHPVISFQEEVLFHCWRWRRFVHAKMKNTQLQSLPEGRVYEMVARDDSDSHVNNLWALTSTRFCHFRVDRVYWNTYWQYNTSIICVTFLHWMNWLMWACSQLIQMQKVHLLASKIEGFNVPAL